MQVLTAILCEGLDIYLILRENVLEDIISYFLSLRVVVLLPQIYYMTLGNNVFKEVFKSPPPIDLKLN